MLKLLLQENRQFWTYVESLYGISFCRHERSTIKKTFSKRLINDDIKHLWKSYCVTYDNSIKNTFMALW